MTLKEAIGILVSVSEARSGQWAGVAQGIPPSDLIDELYEADEREALHIAKMINEAIKTVRRYIR